jgi:ubiquinone/menaquinone biosynthesis C-methylase UbiE
MSELNREEFIKHRYERWRLMKVPFDYKRSKSERIAEIIRGTGGLPQTALELGVGPGGIASPLSRHGVHVVGMDLSADALLRAKDYCRDDNVSLLRGSGFALPFADNTLPLVYASQVLHLFSHDDRLALMREVHRVLEPGSRFVFDMKNVVTHAIRYLRSTPRRFADIETRPGLLPGLTVAKLPNVGILRRFAHTVFFVARKR